LRAIVVDSSVLIAFLLPEHTSGVARRFFVSSDDYDLIAPQLLFYEAANALKSGLHRKRITTSDVGYLLERVRGLEITADMTNPASLMEEIIAVAARTELAVYDAAYLELAIRAGAELATFDDTLGFAAAKSKVKLAI
jgi:predicted nucleic acid-binding protein